MKKYNILVFPCGSEIALDIYSSVKYSTYFNLIGGSSVDDHGKFVYEDYISNIPYIKDKDFIPVLQLLVKERHIDAIYPAMDLAITILKENENKLGCKIIAPPVETTRISLSKEMTYRYLEDVICTPEIYDSQFVPDDKFPVFAKPKIGYGSRGTKKLFNQEEVNLFVKDKDDLLILEYLSGEEYTVDCFTNKNGVLLYCAARKRNRIKDGISVNTTFVENQEEFEDIAIKINSKVKFRGAWFYQVKRNKEGKLCLLEIAARLGGSSLLSRAIGVNFALLSLFDAFDYDVCIFKNDYYVELDRALGNKYRTNLEFDSVYCDYDDCLILDKTKVNTLLVQFLYKCFNERKEIYLLSKHEYTDLMEELKYFRLDSIFDKIIHIDKNADKCEYITSVKPIFIDDSNAERLNVKCRLGIPVFSPEMIDVLI